MSTKETWILDAVLCTMDSSRRVRRGSLRIVDGVIAEIRRSRPRRMAPRSEKVEAAGLTVLPGFVQAHLHLCQTLFRNLADDMELMDWLSKRIWKMESAHTAETLAISARLGIHELLSSGTTCILDMGTVRHTEAILEEVRKSGIRANVGKCLMDHPHHTPPYLRESTAQALKEAQELHHAWNETENGRIRVSYAPRFAISCTKELLLEVGALSRRQGALIHTHASENRGEIALVRGNTGRDNIRYFDDLGLLSEKLVLAHCVWLKRAEFQLVRRSGTKVVHCPSSNLKLASGIAQIPEMLRAGITVALGADGASCNNHLDAFGEMRLAALIHKPRVGPKTLRAHEALDLATREGAKALGWFDRIGSIEVGKRADLIALNLETPENLVPDPLDFGSIASSTVYSSGPRNVAWTRVDGRCVYENGKVKTIDRTRLVADARRAQSKILSRIRRLK